MPSLGGTALRLLQTSLYAIEFCCAGLVLALYSYFLSVLADRSIGIPRWEKAVEGIAGAAVLYTLLAVLFTCCLGGKAFFAFLAIALDLAFTAGFVALAVLTRNGAHSCNGYVRTPLGNGPSSNKNGFGSNTAPGHTEITYSVSLGTACRMNSACFAVSVLGAILFAITALVQLFIGRHHQRERRFGPSPANNYTSGSGRRKFWQRRSKHAGGLRDPEMAPVAASGAGGGLTADGAADMRPSHETAFTGSTASANPAAYEAHHPVHGGYHTAPTGTYAASGAATNY